ncbi:MAG: hypothetical protein WCB53_02525 [Terriglobales bacterium]
MKRTLSIALFCSLACATIIGTSNFAQAQRVDFGFAVSGIEAPSASSADGSHTGVSLTGGTYLGFNGDVLFWHNLGFGAEINWRASQAQDYFGQGFNYRPIFYNFNAVYSPKIASHVYVDLVAGIGAEDTHYYTGTVCGIYSCSNYQSISHFDGDFGGGLKLLATHHIFIRPEARVYLVNNNQEFSSNHLVRYGATLGYTFR